MNFKYLKTRIGGVLLGATLLLGIGLVSTANAQGQWGRDRDYRRDRRDNRDYRRDDRYGRGNYGYQVALDRGYQDGLQTGSSDGQRGQSYNPQRSHFFKNATYGYDRSYGNKDYYKQTYRDAFVQGYNQGFRQYGNRRGNNNGRWFPNLGRFPW